MRAKEDTPVIKYQRPDRWQHPLEKRGEFRERSPSSAHGGGHTILTIEEYGLTHGISHTSTAGGAAMELLMGKKLRGVVTLERAAAEGSSEIV